MYVHQTINIVIEPFGNLIGKLIADIQLCTLIIVIEF